MAGDAVGEGLQPLEFTDCLADSPAFRDNLQRHEKELERTSQQIKRLIKEVKDVVNAARRLSSCQLALAGTMEAISFAAVGTGGAAGGAASGAAGAAGGGGQTDDERAIAGSLHHFAALIRTIEDERDRMLGRAHEQIIEPLERFRKEHIGAVKEGKKKFDKKTAKFCQTQERTLGLSTKKPDAVFQEADAAMDMAERDFCAASLEYVCRLQALHERKKFELVETLLGFVFGWWTFHHTAHDVHADAEPRVRDLQLRIQRTRTNFEETSKQTESLMKKMMELRQMSADDDGGGGADGRSGYLFLMEKKAFGTTWSKQYAVLSARARVLALQPYSQLSPRAAGPVERVPVVGARPPAEPAERRFCWEALPLERERPPLVLQARGEGDRAAWLRALRGDASAGPGPPHPTAAAAPQRRLDEAGVAFVERLVDELEARGLREQGLYRVAGVASRVTRLLALASSPPPKGALADPLLWETRTLASALKAYLRALPAPLLPREHHPALIAAAKWAGTGERVGALRAALRDAGRLEAGVLARVVRHLRLVAANAQHNLMGASNLAVVWGPTLLPPDACVASILDLKFHNVLVETMIERYEDVFGDEEPPAPPALSAATVDPAPMHNGLPRSAASSGVPAGCGARYSPHHQRLLQALPPPPPLSAAASVASALDAAPAYGLGRPASLMHRYHDTGASSSGSAESVSSPSASPPPAAGLGVGAALRSGRRVRTLYACLGEAEGELSFEPNQIITDVAPSAEPGWLRGWLHGRHGLVPENYVEPLP